MNICSNIIFLRILDYSETFLEIVRFIVPIGLIIKIAIDMYKNMISNNNSKIKENNNLTIKRIVIAIIIFLIPNLINSVMFFIENIIGDEYNYKGCLTQIDNIDYFIELNEFEDKLNEEIEINESLNEYEKLRQETIALIKSNLSRSGIGDGVYLGKKYNLTEKQLKNLAKVCQKEQGNATGAAWEAALMANRYELYGKKYGSLYNYVMTSGWWAPAKNGTYSSAKLKDSVLNAVRKVLVDGQRPIPLYVDDHDWTGDLIRLVTDGKKSHDYKNHKVYVKDKTVIYNKYGGSYIYYGHARTDKNADPFGYHKSAKKKVENMQSTS